MARALVAALYLLVVLRYPIFAPLGRSQARLHLLHTWIQLDAFRRAFPIVGTTIMLSSFFFGAGGGQHGRHRRLLHESFESRWPRLSASLHLGTDGYSFGLSLVAVPVQAAAIVRRYRRLPRRHRFRQLLHSLDGQFSHLGAAPRGDSPAVRCPPHPSRRPGRIIRALSYDPPWPRAGIPRFQIGN
jgi:hypothetical protein